MSFPGQGNGITAEMEIRESSFRQTWMDADAGMTEITL
jgi:hypothetical protein